MRYQDFTVTVNELRGDGYPVSALAKDIGRAAAVLAIPSTDLTTQLAALAGLSPTADSEASMRATGAALFNWLFVEPVKTHMRLAWDRAQRDGQGLRLRLCIDPAGISAWPWEALYDPERDHVFATSVFTPLVRYFDQANRLGSLARQQADLPLHLLLVLPAMADLDLAGERLSIEQVASGLSTVLRVHALDGIVRRTDLADALLTADYDIVHFSGHGAVVDGRGFVALNLRDGRPDWIHSGTLAQLVLSHKPIKLALLNVCGNAPADDGRAFQGVAPQMVRSGVPAVVAMQFPIADDVATTFAREFYKRLCTGEDAGQVDVAVTYARGMLAALHPGAESWAAPVLYTHAADGVIYRLPEQSAEQAETVATGEAVQMQLLADSLQLSLGMDDDWGWADRGVLATWQITLLRAEEGYRKHLADRRPEVQQIARRGQAVMQRRLAAVDKALSSDRAAGRTT
jgi:hypothetical protein